MRLESIKGRAATTFAAGLVMAGLTASASRGDEPGRLARIFGMGRAGSSAGSNSPAKPSTASMTAPPAATSPTPSYFGGQPALSTPPTTTAGGPIAPKITPKSRVNRPATEADPLVTRVSLGRSDGGGQFGMFLQVFADGTVIDGEGVHHVAADSLRPVVAAVASGDLAKLKGHCGGPAGDFVENVHVVTFERSLGRLRANAFSYSGNPQGCDHAVHNLQKALDELQAKLSPGNPAVAAPAPALGNAATAASTPPTTLPLPLIIVP